VPISVRPSQTTPTRNSLADVDHNCHGAGHHRNQPGGGRRDPVRDSSEENTHSGTGHCGPVDPGVAEVPGLIEDKADKEGGGQGGTGQQRTGQPAAYVLAVVTQRRLAGLSPCGDESGKGKDSCHHREQRDPSAEAEISPLLNQEEPAGSEHERAAEIGHDLDQLGNAAARRRVAGSRKALSCSEDTGDHADGPPARSRVDEVFGDEGVDDAVGKGEAHVLMVAHGESRRVSVAAHSRARRPTPR
jgi:hypothetical protein